MSATAPALSQLVRLELRKTTDTRAGRWLLGLIVAASVAAVVILVIVSLTDPGNGVAFQDYLYTAQTPTIFLLPVLGILTMTSEWSQRTALTTFALIPHRGRVLTAKLLGLEVLALILVVLSVVAALIVTVIATAAGDASWGTVAGPIARAALFDCLFVSCGAAFGLALLNTPVALVGFLLFPSLITGLVSLIPRLEGPSEWINLDNNLTQLLGNDLSATVWAKIAVCVMVWGVLLYAIGYVRVQRRDIV